MPRMHSNNVCSVFCRHGKRQHVFRCIFFFSTPPLPPPAYPVMLFCGCEKGGGPPHLKHMRTLYQGVAAQKAAQHCRGAASSSILTQRQSCNLNLWIQAALTDVGLCRCSIFIHFLFFNQAVLGIGKFPRLYCQTLVLVQFVFFLRKCFQVLFPKSPLFLAPPPHFAHFCHSSMDRHKDQPPLPIRVTSGDLSDSPQWLARWLSAVCWDLPANIHNWRKHQTNVIGDENQTNQTLKHYLGHKRVFENMILIRKGAFSGQKWNQAIMMIHGDDFDLAGEARGEGDGETRGEAEDLGEWGLLINNLHICCLYHHHHHHHHLHYHHQNDGIKTCLQWSA